MSSLCTFALLPRASRPCPRRHDLRRRRLLLERLEDRTLPSGAGIQPTFILYHTGQTSPADLPFPVPTAFTPAAIRQAYGINLLSGDGTGATIAIVDAFDDPKFVNRSPTLPLASDSAFLASDLHQFDVQYGLPEPAGFFTKVDQNGGNAYPATEPFPNSGGSPFGNWEYEEALDVEWVHALAPGAHIILVEAIDASPTNLFAAEKWAGGSSGAQVVSNSWGAYEIGTYGGVLGGAEETTYDSSFVQPPGYGVTYLAGTGDVEAGLYPAFSPDVVAVGGTSLYVNSDGSYNHEVGWVGSGGGLSVYELQPGYQKNVVPPSMSTQFGNGMAYRTIPDVSFDADPDTGVSVYDSYNGGYWRSWWQFGGTSVACPCWAALVGIVDGLRAAAGESSLSGPGQLLPILYSLPPSDFHDVTSGNNGLYNAGPGYDLVTGLGSPVANQLIPDAVGLPYAQISSPAAGSSVAAPPTSYSVTFAQPIDPTSALASAFTVNGLPASSVTLDSTDTIATYTFATNPVTAQGAQYMTLAVAGVTVNNKSVNLTFRATFYYDAVTLAIVSANPPSGAMVQASGFPFDVTFNEPIDPTRVNTSNLVLSQGTVASAVVEPGNETVQYTLTGVTQDGSMTVTIPAGTFKDQYDNPASPSLTATYPVDLTTQTYPTPLDAVSPPGSLVYQGSHSDMIQSATDVDAYTLNINAGQTITVLATTTGGLQPTVVLSDPSNHILGSATAAGPDQSALLQTIPTTSAGTYTVTVSGAGGSTGDYTLGFTLNAALDTANLGGPVNDTLSSAQEIDSSFIALDSGSRRGAVLGTISSSQDYYSFSISAGDAVTLALQGNSPLGLALEDASGTTLATGSANAVTGEVLLSDFVAPVTGTYYAAVMGDTGTTYNLVVTRNADIANGLNVSPAAAQPVLPGQGGAAHVLGDLSSTTTAIAFSELPEQPVNGVSLKGITFGFTVNGQPSTGATFGYPYTGNSKYSTAPDLFGNTAGVLTMNFAGLISDLSFGLVLFNGGTVNNACTVQLYDPFGALVATIPITTTVPPGPITVPGVPQYTLSEALFTYSGAAAARAVLRFNSAAAGTFLLGNLSFNTGEYDFYQLNLAAGAAFQAGTATPSGGPGAFNNLLDPGAAPAEFGGHGRCPGR